MSGKLLSLLMFVCMGLPVLAQTDKTKNFLSQLSSNANDSEWTAQPKLHTIPQEFSKESAVIILEGRTMEYKSDGKDIYIARTLHRIVKVLDDKGIEGFNKMTLYNIGMEKSDIKARTIAPSGKIYNVSADKILETKSEDGLPQFIFAMEGLEKGAEIELLYTERRKLSLFGTETYQFSIPIMNASFTLKSPSRIIFETKGYNGFPAAEDRSTDSKRIYVAKSTNIPGLKEEPYSNYDANQMRIEYRVSYLPEEKPNVRQFTWNDFAKNLYTATCTFTDKEKKIIRSYLKTLDVKDADDELVKIRKIEDGIKSSINTSDDIKDEDSYNDFNNIISRKVTSEEGQIRFFTACLTVAGIPFEIGMTSNRFTHPLDDKFENWKPLEYYVIYFPNQQQYLFPTGQLSRMPFIPAAMISNKAVFCKVTTLGNMTSAIASIRTIPPMPISSTNHDIIADIRFTGADMTPEIKLAQEFAGYSAMGVREVFVYVPKEKEKEFVTQITDIASSQDDITSYTVENAAFSNYYENKPLIVTSNVRASKLMGKAGPKYLFKAGEVIGKQVEMYQEKKRVMPIELAYPHTLFRKLTIHIPEGYKVTNPDALKFSVSHKNSDGKETMAFVSTYTLENNILTVSITEFYAQLYYSVSDTDIYRKVVNAAADFNKVVLVFEKK